MKPPSDDDNNGRDRPDAPRGAGADAPAARPDGTGGREERIRMVDCAFDFYAASFRLNTAFMFLDVSLSIKKMFMQMSIAPARRDDIVADAVDGCLGGLTIMVLGLWAMAVGLMAGAAAMLRWIAAVPGVGG